MNLTLAEKLRCAGCRKRPAEIPQVVHCAAVEEMTPDEFILEEEGTLDRETGAFLCDACYIDAGMPTTATGWTAPWNFDNEARTQAEARESRQAR